MTDQKEESGRSLEMRVAELEDKLAKLQVTEEEMRAYEKVSTLLGAAAATQGADFPMSSSTAVPGQVPMSTIGTPRLVCINRGVAPRVVRYLCNVCYECTCGPCSACLSGGGGGGVGGGGFGNFGM
jgi:hypothetical protein